jgi:hypothetical protein
MHTIAIADDCIAMKLKDKQFREYERPAMQVLKLNACTTLLSGSGDLDYPNNYSDGGDPFEF